MPMYEYICRECSTKFDSLVRHRDLADTVSCPECSGSKVRRLVSDFAMVGGYDDQMVQSQSESGGGCCGGSCGCGH
jgi:putative FmdB family regulatory protein